MNRLNGITDAYTTEFIWFVSIRIVTIIENNFLGPEVFIICLLTKFRSINTFSLLMINYMAIVPLHLQFQIHLFYQLSRPQFILLHKFQNYLSVAIVTHHIHTARRVEKHMRTHTTPLTHTQINNS